MNRREWAKRACVVFAGLGVTVPPATVQAATQAVAALEEPPLELGDWVRIVDLPKGMLAVGTLTALEHRHRGKELEIRGRVTRARGMPLWVSLDRLRREPHPPPLELV